VPWPNGHSLGFSLQQFSEVLRIRDAAGKPYVLIGGQAVNYWAERYLTSEPRLEQLQPMRAFEEGQKAGGDSRGMQSAAILIVKDGAGYGGYTRAL
jgi:uncharacterized Ntn-hydrolase superfamily protein